VVISKPTAFSRFQLVWHFLKRFSVFYKWFGIFYSLGPGNPGGEGELCTRPSPCDLSDGCSNQQWTDWN